MPTTTKSIEDDCSYELLYRDSAGRTALELAVANGLTATLRSLCSTGANMNQKTSEGPSVLEKALTSGRGPLFQFPPVV